MYKLLCSPNISLLTIGVTFWLLSVYIIMQPVMDRQASATYPAPVSDSWSRDEETGFLYCTSPRQQGQDFSVVKKKTLLDTYRGTFPDLSEALEQVGVSRRTVFWHLKFDPAFSAAFQEIRELRADKVESRLYKDALTPKQFMAQIAILRAYRPSLYTEKRINLTGKDLDSSTLAHKAGHLDQVVDTELVESGSQRPVIGTQEGGEGSLDPRPVMASQEVSIEIKQKETPNQ